LNDGIIMLSTFWRNLGEQTARKTAGGAAQPSESRHHLRFRINGQWIMSEVTPTLQAAHPQPQKSHDVGRAGMIWVKDSPGRRVPRRVNHVFSVIDIGMRVGFGETSSFTAAFRKATGVAPSTYHRGLL
jgi:AraC-like DNA-binding protein